MKSKNLLLVMVAVTAFVTGSLFAGFDANLNTLDSGVIDISISEIINGVDYGFEGSVEYAVYEPGEFTGPITVPANSYVYAYQVNNHRDSLSGLDVNQFAIGLLPDSGADLPNATYIPAIGEVYPMLILGNDQQIFYLYVANGISPTESSALMIFTSPNGPVDGQGTVVIGTIGSVDVVVPTPVPEPTTMFLLGSGALMLIRRKRS